MVKVAIFSSGNYVRRQLAPLLEKHPGSFHIDEVCTSSTAALCKGAEAVCLFVNDDVTKDTIQVFKENGVKLLLLRCPEVYHLDLEAAAEAGIKVVRVQGYCPHAVAEHAIALTMSLNRRICRAFNRVTASNFNLGGLCGMDMHGKTIGIIGCGKVGRVAARAFKAMGMKLLIWDPHKEEEILALGASKCESIEDLYKESDVISLHVPLTEATKHMINAESIGMMKKGVLLVNTSRGLLVDTQAMIAGLRSGRIGGVALDVYEEEEKLFNQDKSEFSDEVRILQWDFQFATLRSFPNTVITPHSAFLTRESLKLVCGMVLSNLEEYEKQGPLTWEVKP